MLVKQTEISYKDYTMSRQVIDGVVGNLLKLTNIDDPDIVYSTQLSGSNLNRSGGIIGEGREADFGVKSDQVLLEVTETRSEENRIMRGLGLTNLELPLFEDKTYRVGMYSNSVEYKVELELALRHNSRSSAEAWVSDKLSRIESGLDTFVTEGDFHYHIPETCFKLANDVLTASKVNDPNETRTLQEYCSEHFVGNVTTVTDQAGKNKGYVATQRVARVQVIFDNGSVTKEKDSAAESSGGFISRISCEFTYVRPETILLRYPAMFNGTLIDSYWWYNGAVPGRSDTLNAICTPFIAAGEVISNRDTFISLPRYLQPVDLTLPTFVKRDETELPIIVTYLTPEEKVGEATPLFNLRELGDVSLGDSMLNYITTNVETNQYLISSLINIYFIINGTQTRVKDIAVSPDLTVWYNGAMDMRSIYQLVITLNLNLTGIDDDTFDDLRRSPLFVRDFLSDFYPKVRAKHEGTFDEDVVEAAKLDLIVDDATSDPLLNQYKSIATKSSFMINILNGRLIAHLPEEN